MKNDNYRCLNASLSKSIKFIYGTNLISAFMALKVHFFYFLFDSESEFDRRSSVKPRGVRRPRAYQDHVLTSSPHASPHITVLEC